MDSRAVFLKVGKSRALNRKVGKVGPAGQPADTYNVYQCIKQSNAVDR